MPFRRRKEGRSNQSSRNDSLRVITQNGASKSPPNLTDDERRLHFKPEILVLDRVTGGMFVARRVVDVVRRFEQQAIVRRDRTRMLVPSCRGRSGLRTRSAEEVIKDGGAF